MNLEAALVAARRGITTVLVADGVTVKVEPTTESFAQLRRVARRARTYAALTTSFPAQKGNPSWPGEAIKDGPALTALRGTRIEDDA